MIGPVFLYVLSAFVVFDFTSSAIHAEWETFDGRPVAAGPRPRYPFDRGANLHIPGGWDYSGDEVVFQIYRPVVRVWQGATGVVDIATVERAWRQANAAPRPDDPTDAREGSDRRGAPSSDGSPRPPRPAR